MNRSSNIFHFVSETGTTQQVAQSLLEEHGWNVVQAVKSYQCRQMGLKSREPAAESVAVGLPSDPATLNQATTLIGEEIGSGTGIVLRRKESTDDLEKDDDLETNINSVAVNSHQLRLKRGMSNTMNNAHIVSIAHDLVLNGIKESSGGGGAGGAAASASAAGVAGSSSSSAVITDCQKDQQVMDTLSCTFILPDINHYPPEFRAFLHKDLIETSTLISLEQAGRLNWWADLGVCQRLLPLATTGDGNCLLHAASLGIWGFHDRRLTLRKALCHTLNESSARDAFQRRWRFHQNQINKQSGLIYSEQEWTQEWDNLLKLASPRPRKNGVNGSDTKDATTDGGDAELFYESLEELHVFVLAHVLCRPIIIVADTILKDSNGDALAPISFGGIYLPMECDPVDCYPTPLLLTYDAAHFSAIVPMEHSPSPDAQPPLAAAIPVVDPDFNLLPIHFAVDPGDGCAWEGNKDGGSSSSSQQEEDPLLSSSESCRLDLLRRYLNLENLSVRSADSDDARNGLGGGGLGRAKAGSCSDLIHSPSIECEDMSQVTLTIPKGDDRRRGSVRGKRGGGGGTGGGEEESGGERARVLPRSMQNMVRSFGSLGRSFRNRIKNMAKTGKQQQTTDGQTTTTSTKGKTDVGRKTGQRGKATVATTVDRDHVLCARLQHRRQAFQEDMVRNYLQTALEKFERERKSFSNSLENGGGGSSSGWMMEVLCVNSNCQGQASASTSYLCQSCFERQRQDELGVTTSTSSASTSSTSKSTPSHPSHPPPSSLDDDPPPPLGIDRVQSGPVLPRYVTPHLPHHPPQLMTSSAAKSCSSLNQRNTVSSSSTVIPPLRLASTSNGQSTFSTSSTSSTVNGATGSSSQRSNATTTAATTATGGATVVHGDLTLYREGPPLNQDQRYNNTHHHHHHHPTTTTTTKTTTGPLLSKDHHHAMERPQEADEVARDRSCFSRGPDRCLDGEGGVVVGRKQVDAARNFEKELENSLDDLQKSVAVSSSVGRQVANDVTSASRIGTTGGGGGGGVGKTVTVDGLKGRMHSSVAETKMKTKMVGAGGGGGVDGHHGNSSSSGASNGYICSTVGPHD